MHSGQLSSTGDCNAISLLDLPVLSVFQALHLDAVCHSSGDKLSLWRSRLFLYARLDDGKSGRYRLLGVGWCFLGNSAMALKA